MEYPPLQELQYAALCLVIPAAIVLGHRRPSGPIVAFGGALLLLAALALAFGSAAQARRWETVTLLTVLDTFRWS